MDRYKLIFSGIIISLLFFAVPILSKEISEEERREDSNYPKPPVDQVAIEKAKEKEMRIEYLNKIKENREKYIQERKEELDKRLSKLKDKKGNSQYKNLLQKRGYIVSGRYIEDEIRRINEKI